MVTAKKRPSEKLSGESGIALLLAIFTLMLLSAIGLALLGATDLETQIAANYRDKQGSLYASLSGLQEARDRLIPSRCPKDGSSSCKDPTALDTRTLGLPTPTAKNVIYLINPDTSAGETASSIRPWSPTTASGDPNPYFDSDLCSSNYMGTNLCSGGVPPTTSAWYKVYDDSQSYAGPYQSGVSTGILYTLPYKWVRITLKADDITPVMARASTDGSQMCWDGKHQLAVPSGYDNTCTTVGGILLFDGTSTCWTCNFSPAMGHGYVSPIVTIDPPGGGGATATATAHVVTAPSDEVAYVNLTDPGSGYTSQPSVTIAPPASGTQATATISYMPPGSRSVQDFTSVVHPSPKGCYDGTPPVSITGGGGSGAKAYADMSGTTCIASWSLSLSSNCASQKGNTIAVGASGGSGSGFVGSVTISNNGKSISSYSITDPGSGYNAIPSGVTSSTACNFSATWTLGRHVDEVKLDSGQGGSGYTSTPTVSISAPTAPVGQAPPTTTAVMTGVDPKAGTVTAINLTNTGSGYLAAPTVTISGGSPTTNATATAVIGSTGKIDSITLTSPGSGYTTTPSVTITDGGGGTGATIQAKFDKLTNYGKVYVLTSLAVNQGGSKSMSQMETATAPAFPPTFPGALVLDSKPTPTIGLANSNIYTIDGHDLNSCGETAKSPKAAIGLYDDIYDPNSPPSTDCVTSLVGGTQISGCAQQPGTKPGNYTGSLGSTPDVQNVYGSLGKLTTVAGVDALATTIASNADYTYNPPPGTPITALSDYGDMSTSPPNCPTTVVNGDLTLNAKSGCGVLLVTGKLTMQGNYDWYGPVFVIGDSGEFLGGGGGTGNIHGSLFLAQTKDPATGKYLTTLGDVSYQIQGGGGNNIWYDHCWADNMFDSLGDPLKSPHPLKVLSVRSVY